MSEYCLGTATFGEDGWGCDEAEAGRILDVYLEAGGFFVDSSSVYAGGRSEEILGRLIRGRRDELVVGTKYTASWRPGDVNVWGSHRKGLRQTLDRSLRNLGVDYLDVLWVHSWDQLTPLEEMMRALDDEVRAGRILYVGVSNTPAWATARATTIAELRGWTPFAGMQAEYSLASRTPEHELIPMAHALGLEVLAWSPLAGGVLGGGYAGQGARGSRYPKGAVPPNRQQVAEGLAEVAAEIGQPSAAVAFAWLHQRPKPPIVMLGARTAEQLKGNLPYLDLELDADTLRRLDELSEPAPIMPKEGLDMPGLDVYFHGGAGPGLVDYERSTQ